MKTDVRRSVDVRGEFDEVGPHYDRLVRLSPGYSAQLAASARAFVTSLTASDGPAPAGGSDVAHRVRVLDLGCGSGASTTALVMALTEAGLGFEIDGVDASAGMLASAQAKGWPVGVRFRQARAEELTAGDAAYDGVFAAYLLRNVDAVDRDELLRTIWKLLAPGGVLLIHDYCVRGREFDERAWTALCWGVIIPTAVVVTRRPALFTYLWRSVLHFDSQEELMARLVRTGYQDIRARAVPGWQQGMVRMAHGRRAR